MLTLMKNSSSKFLNNTVTILLTSSGKLITWPVLPNWQLKYLSLLSCIKGSLGEISLSSTISRSGKLASLSRYSKPLYVENIGIVQSFFILLLNQAHILTSERFEIV